jgi:D-alanyl-D-alanine carboxypeptidase
MSTYYYKYELFEGENFKSMGLRKWWNTNKLLMKGWEGVKTGQTVTAGSCLCSLREGIFITVLNSDTADSRFTDT